jgi:hypothetical protein
MKLKGSQLPCAAGAAAKGVTPAEPIIPTTIKANIIQSHRFDLRIRFGERLFTIGTEYSSDDQIPQKNPQHFVKRVNLTKEYPI